uniref:Type 3 secretion system stator protein n=1 Tax=uncultured Thiotrichaceae bacterium TaxID=298394 RepID=A0A6S6U920_9GAMM|nr:MAG: HrpE/YscL family type III secretion apparatus protein [uncultured Thiotrichaceae bacterium]
MDKFISVKPLDSQLKPGQKVLKSADYQQLLSYESVLSKLSIREKQRQTDASEMLEKSIRHGKEQGMEQANQQLAEELQNFTLRMHQSLCEIEESLVDVVVESVKKIIHGFDDETLVKNTVRSGLELVRGGKKLTVRVHPQMLGVIQEQLGEFEKTAGHIEVLPDGVLKVDECILESDVGIVSASVEQQVEALVKALRRMSF